MSRYIRSRTPGGTFFFTVAILERRRTLLTDHIHALRAAFTSVQRKQPFTVEAVVVLPDHLHCIWTLPEGDPDFSLRWQAIKSNFSRSLPKGEYRSVRRMAKGERGIWQRRFWEHTIRDEPDLSRHTDYIHYNPVKHGYVRQAVDWPFSTFRRYVQRGTYPHDWGANDNVRGMTRE